MRKWTAEEGYNLGLFPCAPSQVPCFYRFLREFLRMECTEITSRIKVSSLTSQEKRYD